jgi:hypothetical protein
MLPYAGDDSQLAEQSAKLKKQVDELEGRSTYICPNALV